MSLDYAKLAALHTSPCCAGNTGSLLAQERKAVFR